MKECVIPPRSGARIEAEKGQRITITDVCGGQVADLFAVMRDEPEEYLSPSVTIDCGESLRVGAGTVLYSNLYRQMLEVVRDDVGRHDLLFPACSRKMYDFFYQNGEGHPNCLDNLNLALGTERSIIQPVNLFMNTVIGEDGRISIGRPLSKAGDSVVLLALESCVLAVSACSVSECATNGGACTPIAVRVD